MLDACVEGPLPAQKFLFPLPSPGFMMSLSRGQSADEVLVLGEEVPFGSLQGRNALVQAAVFSFELLGGTG
jgi:hypothetical protein